MGESKRKQQRALIQGGGEAEQAQVVDTLGGRMHVRGGSWLATGAMPTSPRCVGMR